MIGNVCLRPVGTRGGRGEGWGPCACPGGNASGLGCVRPTGLLPTRTSTRPPHPPRSAPCPYRMQDAPSPIRSSTFMRAEGKIMSKFTDIELEYLKTQRLGRLATMNKHGEPQIAPVTFLYNAELDTIDIGGLQNGESQKFRNVARNGLASFVVDDVLPPFQPRGIEIRGHAEALPDGGQRISPNFSPALIRLTPGRIISWNLTSGDPAQTHSARNV